ncbi:BQ5605_C035g11393 [Microbotryum silenes-dioicae]|uniref:BQ5605_C035g11393 protein n=1 Tax=Microbotryum silenes-dioicae TaxID=796604 RepID=A0A2X0MJS8_9BASI|nr:BQ5605_C035g11393 [Microbotryum silenes-dioicae]
MGSPSSSSALDHCAARSPETVPVVSAPVVSAPVVSVPVALPAEEVVVDGSLEPAPGAVSPPSSSPPTHHRVTATGVLATTTTALVHNRLTHAAGGMLSSTLTGLFTREFDLESASRTRPTHRFRRGPDRARAHVKVRQPRSRQSGPWGHDQVTSSSQRAMFAGQR